MLHMHFDKVILILGCVNVQTSIRYQPPFVEWILIRMTESHEFIVLLEIGEFQIGRPTRGFERSIQRRFHVLH